MRIRTILISGVTAAAFGLVALAGPASADVSTNDTTRDAYGYCQANHIANFNGDFNGIGHIRSTQSGEGISSEAGKRAPAQHCVATQGVYAPISSND